MNALRSYLAGQSLSAFGDSLMPIALVFAVFGNGGSATAVGLVLLASRVPAMLVVLLGGAVGDRFDRRLVMLGADAARCVLQASTGALLLTGHASLWLLAVLQAFSGLASALFGPAAAGLVRSLAPPAGLSRVNALLGLSRNIVGIGGQVVAGVLVSTVGSGWCFIVDAVTFAASAVFLSRLPAAPPTPADRPETLLRSALGGVRAAMARRWVWTSILYIATLNLIAVCPFLVLGPVVADTDLGGAAAWAAIVSGYAAGGIGGNLLALRWQPRYPLVAAFAAAIGLGPLLFLLAAAAPVPALVLAAGVAGAQAAVFNTFHGSTLQTHIPERLVSRVASVNILGSLAAVPLGLGLAGPLAQATSSRTVLTVGGCFAVLGTLAVLLVRDVRRLGRITAQPRPRRGEDPILARPAA